MNPILKMLITRERKKCDNRASAGSTPPVRCDEITERRNIAYRNDGDPFHRMDLYRPNTAVIPTPVVINIHGGGLITGRKEVNRNFCINLCRMGFLVFSIDYRLCPEVTFFDQLEDVYAAMNCIDGMMPMLKAEAGQCYMVGDGAGAMLAMYASAVQRNPVLAKAAGIRPSYLSVTSLALISMMFDVKDRGTTGRLFCRSFYGDHYRKHPFYPYLKPRNAAVCMSLPPCILFTSKPDEYRHATLDLARAIRHLHLPCILRDYGRDPRLTLAFAVFHPSIPESQRVIEDITSFFTEYE